MRSSLITLENRRVITLERTGRSAAARTCTVWSAAIAIIRGPNRNLNDPIAAMWLFSSTCWPVARCGWQHAHHGLETEVGAGTGGAALENRQGSARATSGRNT